MSEELSVGVSKGQAHWTLRSPATEPKGAPVPIPNCVSTTQAGDTQASRINL